MDSMRGPTVVRLLLLGLIVIACGPGGAAPARHATPPARLTVAVGADPETLDPAAVSTAAAAQVVRMAIEPLLDVDQLGRVKPLLAVRWDVSPDGTDYTFTLRKGVRFSDGEPLDAAAVRLSLERLLDRRTVGAQPRSLTIIADVRIIDPARVGIRLRGPFPQLPQALAQVQAGVVAPGSVSASPLTPPQLLRLVGTGPYVLTDRVIGKRLTLTRNSAYWGRQPGYGVQTFEVVPDADAREALVTGGRADVAVVPMHDLPALERNPDVRVRRTGSDGLLVARATVSGVYTLPDGQLVTVAATRT